MAGRMRIVKDKNTGENHMYEDDKYVGWSKVEKEKKAMKKVKEDVN